MKDSSGVSMAAEEGSALMLHSLLKEDRKALCVCVIVCVCVCVCLMTDEGRSESKGQTVELGLKS